LMRPYDAVLAAMSVALWTVIEAVARDRTVIKGFLPVFAGFAAGLRNREPVRPVVSRTYRRNFHSFDRPWRYLRSPIDRWRVWRGTEAVDVQRRRLNTGYFDERRAFYPEGPASLRL
jgi:hypothetical protein